MKFIVRKYYSGYCTYEIEAENEDEAHSLAKDIPINEIELLSTLVDWEECDEVDIVPGDTDQK